MIEMPEDGDLQAIEEIGDRFDGKCANDITRRSPLAMLSGSRNLREYRKKSMLRFA